MKLKKKLTSVHLRKSKMILYFLYISYNLNKHQERKKNKERADFFFHALLVFEILLSHNICNYIYTYM